MTKQLISIIIPAYNESDCVEELAKRLSALFDVESNYGFECIFIENGSIDDTYDKLIQIHNSDSRFKIIRLSRNFRMDGGLTAGLEYVKGDACVLMTADLQDPPELISEFIRKWEAGFENVYGVVTQRQGTGIIRTFNSKAFYWLSGKLTNGLVTKNASDFRLVDRKVYSSVRAMQERNRFVRGLFSWVGYKSIGIEMVRPPRFAGNSKAYTFKVLDLAFKGIFAHSYLPLRAVSVVGALVSVFALIMMLVATYKAVVNGVPFDGFGTLVLISLFGTGVLSIFLGVIGEYIGLIYEEVKGRPNFVVSSTIGL
jgi:dolichol-phosphate mannosyltransferase